mgnify:CR=1 FL=1
MSNNREPNEKSGKVQRTWNKYNIYQPPENILMISTFSMFDISGETDNVNKISDMLYKMTRLKSGIKNPEKDWNTLNKLVENMKKNLEAKPNCESVENSKKWLSAVRGLMGDNASSSKLLYITKDELNKRTGPDKLGPPRPTHKKMLQGRNFFTENGASEYLQFAQAMLLRNDVQDLMKNGKTNLPRPSTIYHKSATRSLKEAIRLIKRVQGRLDKAEKKLSKMKSKSSTNKKRMEELEIRIGATKDYIKDTMKSFPNDYKHGLDQEVGQTQAAGHATAPPLPPLSASAPPAPPPPPPPPPAANMARPNAPPTPPPRPEPVKMPGKFAMPTSTLNTPPRPQSEQKNQRTPSLLTSDLLDKMLSKLSENGWTRTSPPFENNNAQPVVVGKGKESFTIGLDKMTTNSNSEETFSAMLQAHISAHGEDVSKMPRITTNPNDAKKWEKLVKAAYKVDKVPEGVIEMKQAPAPIENKPAVNQPADPQQGTEPVSPRINR